MRHRLRYAWPAVLLLLATAALVMTAILYVTRGSFVLERLASNDINDHLDFDTFWRSTVALLDGRDIYRTNAAYPNLNPPLFTVLIAPLGLLDVWQAYRLWVLLSTVLIVGSMLLVAVELRMRAAAVVPVVVAALLSSPAIATLGLGQMYPVLAAVLATAWALDRRGRWVLAGVALGLVVALKPSLAPVLLVPALRRRWPTFGAALLTGTAATVLAWIVCGAQSTPEWARRLRANPMTTYWDNASLPGTIQRLTSANDWGRPIIEVPNGAVIGLVLGLGLLAITIWLVRRPPVGPDTALWAVAAASLLASPLTWHNYLLVLMPAILVLVTRGSWPVAALLLALSLIGMEWPPLWYGEDNTAPALPVSLYCAILLAYWTALLPRPPRTPVHPAKQFNSDDCAGPRHVPVAVPGLPPRLPNRRSRARRRNLT